MTQESMPKTRAARPEFRNINAFEDLTTYRLPLAGWVSILHRASGALMFILLPLLVWLFDTSVRSETSHAEIGFAFENGLGWFPAFLFKLVLLSLIWAYLHHMLAGVRHLFMDSFHKVSKEFGASSARVVLALSLGLTVLLGAKLFGLY